MPEIKNTFLQGKMNKDLDERLVPNGEYRDAQNIEVSTSESSNVGVVKNILGNHRLENIVDTSIFKCVGSIANEKTDKLYWFISSDNKDAIIEYDVTNDVTQPVVVDMHAGTSKSVLKFTGNIITGISIIDDLLFWTDNNSEPKKINIETCKKGTVDIDSHTQLSFDRGGFHAITLDKVSNDANNNRFSKKRPKKGRYFWVSVRQFALMLGYDLEDFIQAHIDWGTSQPGESEWQVKRYRDGNFLGEITVAFFSPFDEFGNFEIDSAGSVISTNGTHGRRVGNFQNDFHIGDMLYGTGTSVDLQEKHITVIKTKPLNTLSVKINHSDSATTSQNKSTTSSTGNIPNLFETKFPRFSYRYRYSDGEYSAFAPFTDAIFNPKYPKNTSIAGESEAFYNQDNVYDTKDSYNKAMVNSIHSVELSNFITAQTLENVIEVDILYKQEESSVIYSIATIKHNDEDWHYPGDDEGGSVGIDRDSEYENFMSIGGYTKGKYIVSTENIYAALPANQLLRPWDNVPKKALAQDVTGNRIVYGNYVQNYNFTNNTIMKVGYEKRNNIINSFARKALPSVKSQRNYQLGVVYCDRYGRETPVFTSKEGAVNVPWQGSSGNKNASTSNQLRTKIINNFPQWVDSIKFFVKETSNEYYNLTMDRAWISESTYELDDADGHIWISFPSSDRNKISENDYIILKKKIGNGENQINFENKYKVLDIKNEAPDAIKYELVHLGDKTNYTSSPLEDLMYHSNRRIDRQNADVIILSSADWAAGFNAPLESGGQSSAEGLVDVINSNDLYLSWQRVTGTNKSRSKKYKVSKGKYNNGANTPHYVLHLSTPITRIDADIAHEDGDSSDTSTTGFHSELNFAIEEKKLRDEQDFSGKFFVKISKNQVTDFIENGSEVNVLDKFLVKAKNKSWYWQDDIGQDTAVTSANHGVLNYTGYVVTYTSYLDTNYIQHGHAGAGANNVVGNITADGDVLKTTDYWEAWQGIKTKHKPTFFVDSMYLAAGQSDASDNAKYCCVTWAGMGANSSGTNDNVGETGSAWSYPPLLTWLNESDVVSSGDSDYSDFISDNEKLIYTSPVLSNNEDWDDLPVDGWIGPLQKVDRVIMDNSTTPHKANKNHVNGLEGFLLNGATRKHVVGPRRWFSGMTGTEYGVGVDTKTYSHDGEEDRHFMHLSFFAPGDDLHDSNWDNLADTTSEQAIYGENSWSANLQGIWGGGAFTGSSDGDTFGATNDHTHFPMETNNSSNGDLLFKAPGPGVGFGYDINYREKYERQWDPTFNSEGDDDNEIRDFIRNLHPGSQFRFNRPYTTGSVAELIDDTVYTIKNVTIKKIYNHTSWRKTYNRYVSNEGYYYDTPQHIDYQSVERVALDWLDGLDSSGIGTSSTLETKLKSKIEQFGAAHNRRVCYIIELDKNPVDSESALGNPISAKTIHNSTGAALPNDCMNADVGAQNYCNIEFLTPVKDVKLKDLDKFPAIWEIDPKKKEVDLDIYYEASNAIPVRINETTNELFAPIGCRVEVMGSKTATSGLQAGTAADGSNVFTTSRPCILESWDNNVATFHPGFPKGGVSEIDYTGVFFKFIKKDGSYVVAQAGEQQLTGEISGLKRSFEFREDVGNAISAGLSWYNCFSFGNGLESNRIKDDFNETFITNGVKASTTTQQIYEEERKKHGLIYSGLYNSNSGTNDLNQFIMAEKITKDLNPTYGSIQKLFSRNSDLVTFCEDKVVKVLANKDAVYNADGNPQLTANENVLGQAIPFVGEYGISNNPESFASESYRAYFTDKQRGSVLRLSQDGLTPISNAGMKDWFRDNLRKYESLIGTYDSYKEDYNITLTNNPNFNENIITDSFLSFGVEFDDVQIGSENQIENPGVFSGVPLSYLYEPNQYDVLATDGSDVNNPFVWPSFTQEAYDFIGYVKITHHAAIPYESLQNEVPQSQAPDIIISNTIPFSFATYTPYDGSTGISYYSNYENGGLLDDGWIFDHVYDNVSDDLFGANRTLYADYSSVHVSTTGENGIYCDLERNIFWQDPPTSSNISFHQTVDEDNPSGTTTSVLNTPIGSGSYSNYYTYWQTGYDPAVEKIIEYPLSGDSPINRAKISGAITRDSSDKTITFDRCHDKTYLQLTDIGDTNEDGINKTVNDASGVPYMTNGGLGSPYGGSAWHGTMFNGDELHIQVKLICYKTVYSAFDSSNPTAPTGYHAPLYGYNYIEPQIELLDCGMGIPSDKIQSFASTAIYTGSDPYLSYNPYKFMVSHNDGSDRGPGSSFNQITLTGGQYGGYNEVAGNTYSPPLTHGDWTYIKGLSSSSTVTFPNTNNIPEATVHYGDMNVYGNQLDAGVSETFTLYVGASFKFRDPNQQAADGTSNNITYDNDGNLQISTTLSKVISKLEIVIKNDADSGPAAAFGGVYGGTNITPLARQLWKVEKVLVRKGFGAVGPHIEYVPEVTTPGLTTHYVAPVPPELPTNANPLGGIPAWTQVEHLDNKGFGNNTWSIDDDAYGSSTANTLHTHQQITSGFGGDYPAVVTYGDGQNQSDVSSTPTSNAIEYMVPGTPPTGDYTQPANINSVSANTFDRASFGQYPLGNNTTGHDSQTPISFNNDFLYIEHISSGHASDILYDDLVGNDVWQVNEWYLVDIEYDNTSGNNTGLGADGLFWIHGVADGNFTTNQGAADPDNGVGLVQTNNSNTIQHIQLVPADRTEYGTPREVLRGIFQVHPDSYRATTNPHKFRLRVRGCTNGVKINKIIAKKLTGGIWSNWISTNGFPTDWITNPLTAAWSNFQTVHAFDKKHLYFFGGKLCWEFTLNTSTWANYSAKFEQEFPTALTISPLGWKLKFTITDNPKTNNPISGSLSGFVTGENATGATEGVYFENIQDIGSYSIQFTFDGDITTWSIKSAPIGFDPDGASGSDYTTASLTPTSSATIPTGATAAFFGDKKIFFFPSNLTTSAEYAIGNISLTDSSNIFTGGSATSWNFSGFNTSLDNYIQWIADPTTNEGYISLNTCPVADNSFNQLKFININQNITNTINQFEQYKISLLHNVEVGSSATLAVYYYNTQGFGFKLTDIVNDAQNNTIVSAPGFHNGWKKFEKTVTIGELDSNGVPTAGSVWSASQSDPLGIDDYSNYDSDLKNSFVIVVQGSVDQEDLISGFIDNISMVKTYDINTENDKTISFSEDVNGWTSFKSFIPENGASLSKKYFTFDQGALFQHYVPLKLNPTSNAWEQCDENVANNYNRFYGITSYNSSVTAMLNQEPSTVKSFRTLNYEGSQAKILRPVNIQVTDPITNTSSVVLSADQQVNANNAEAFFKVGDIEGWVCSSISTDLESGSVIEFIKKEGKWFNYIKGKHLKTNIDTSANHVQGIGMASSVVDVNVS